MFDITEQVRRLLDPILESQGLDLWDMEFQKQGPKWLLRIYIDREIGGGITIDDCEAVSRDFAAALDVEDIIQHAYTLEVSSPGLDRILWKPEHFIRFAGDRIKIKTVQPIGGEKVFRGKLLGIGATTVQIEQENGSVIEIPMGNIARASLEVDF